MSQPPRPAFEPKICRERSNIALNNVSGRDWRAIVQCNAHFPLHMFEPVMKNLIYYPELTIALILRAEIISKDDHLQFQDLVHNAMDQEEQINGFIPCETIHRKLIPKVPERDAPLRQDCILYRAEDGMDVQLVVFIPKMDPKQRMPHYHPDVKAIAFQYIPSTSDDTSILRIDVPLDDPSAALPSSRLFKTCVVLLDTISKHGWGLFNGYKKRVVHDTIVPKETYQDFYYVMKEKYKYLKDEWKESTDPTKNVFEDIGIATFLMLLWRDTYRSEDYTASEVWGRPPAGFIDVGCGAGLLVHILTCEGYEGKGVDLRARKSWGYYPTKTRERLSELPLDPLAPGFPSSDIFPPGIFLIGNHADELSPWLPVIASLVNDAAYISIPCCPWSLDQKYIRSSNIFPQLDAHVDENLETKLGATAKSTYGSYICWLSALSQECGFEGEYEALRIPSTRNWSIIGRKRISHYEGKVKGQELLKMVIDRGIFKARQGLCSNH